MQYLLFDPISIKIAIVDVRLVSASMRDSTWHADALLCLIRRYGIISVEPSSIKYLFIT